jgi:hypothetical protein
MDVLSECTSAITGKPEVQRTQKQTQKGSSGKLRSRQERSSVLIM